MKKEKLFIGMNLQLFADGGEGISAEGGNGEATGVGQNPTDTNEGVSQVASDSTNTEDFDSLIGKGGRFEQNFRERMSSAVQERVKNIKPKAEAYDRLAPTLERISRKYGVDASDIDALAAAVESDSEIDDAMYEQEALENGWSVEHTKEVHELRAFKEEQDRRAAFNSFIQDCHRQSDEFKSIVPGFDFDYEFQNNERFGRLVSNGISVRDAYMATHADEYVTSAMKATAQQTKQQVVQSIISGSRRPSENGNGAGGSANFGVNVAALTDKELEDYSRRAANGEPIDFINRF